MIEYIKGELTELTPATATVETRGGVGYLLNISLATFNALEGKKEVRLLVQESIREDAYVLYGFDNARERDLFRLLIGVSGVGANTARMILSSLSVGELEQAIASDDIKRIKAVKGIGAKTAERIIVDLRDKIKAEESTLLEHQASNSIVFDEALTALTVLGYARPQAQKVLKKIFEADSSVKVDSAIRKALAMM